MKNAIILHGMGSKEEYYSLEYPSGSNSHWLPWLQKQLLTRDILAVTIEMPHNFAPDYAVWRREFERFDITPETILVGHSCGGGFLVRWLSEHKDVKVGRVVLVAPWLDPNKEDTTDFFDFEIDTALVARTDGITIFESDNDDVSGVAPSVSLIRENVAGVKHILLNGYGHFCLGDMGTVEFPELLEEVLK
jgi:uncharacterized protein